MNTKKLMTLLLAVVLVLSLAACGAKGGDHMDGMDNEPKNAEEAAAMHKELTAQEAAILAENTALWEKVFILHCKGRSGRRCPRLPGPCRGHGFSPQSYLRRGVSGHPDAGHQRP